MISKRDVQLGKIALKEKMVSKEQINKALKIKKKLKTKASLGAILVKKGYISKDQLEIIVSLHNSTSSQSGDETTTSSKTSGRRRRATAASKRRKAASAAEEKRSRRRKTRSRDGEDKSDKSEKGGDGEAREAEAAEDEATTIAAGDETSTEDSKESKRSKRRKTRSKRSKTRSKRRKTEDKAGSDDETEKADDADKTEDDKAPEDKGSGEGDEDSTAETDEESAERDVDVDQVKEETREATKDRMAEVLAAALLSGPADDEDYDTGEDEDEREKRKRREREMESGQFLSAALFKSAAVDESDEYDSIGKAFKKIIACKDCGKKYRVKPSQAGKKFKCRRCKSMVRVPEDYFEDDAVEEVEPKKKKRKSKRSRRSKRSKTDSKSKSRTSKRRKKSSPKVEEFDLSELDDDDDSAADEDSKSEPAEEPKKKGIEEASYRDLARAAAKAPKTKPKQAAMTTGAIIQMVLFTLLLVAVVGGFYGFKKYQEQQARERFLAALKAEWDEIEPQISGPAQRARALLEEGGEELEDLSRLTEAANACQGVLGMERQCAYPANREKAEKLINTEFKVSEMRHKLLVRKAMILERSKDFRSQEDAIRAYNTALGVDQKVASTWTRYALALAKARRWTEAVEATNEALKLDDRDEARVLAARGFIYELGGASRLAADTYERLVAIKPFAAVLRARALIAAGARQDAGKVLDELQSSLTEEQTTELAIVHIYRARSAAAGDDLAAAEAAARKALATDAKSPWPALELGYVLLRQGRYLDARNAFTEAETKGGVRRAALGLGKAHLGALNLEEALAALRRAASGSSTEGSTGMLIAEVPVMLDPLDMADPGSEAYRELGDIYRARGELDLARTSYQDAVANDPWNLKAHAALADLMLVEDDANGAGYEVELALRLTEGIKQGKVVTLGGVDRVKCAATAYVLMVVGSHAQQSGNLSKAENALDLALDLRSTAEIMTRLASVRSQRNQRTNSRADYRNALGKERGDTLYQQATAMLGKDGPDGWRDAIAAANALLASNPHFSLAYTLRGMANLKLDKREAGLADLNRAVAINPQNKDALLERGLLHARGDKKVAPDWASARRDFEAVIAIDPTRTRARLGLSEALHLEGRPRKALEQVNEVLKIEFNNKEALRLRAKIYRQLGDVKKAEADERKAGD